MPVRKVNVADVARLPAFCHAVIAGQHVYVSGMLGAGPGTMELVAAETAQALRNIHAILQACHATFADVVKVNVHLTEMAAFQAMNDSYLAVIGDDPPARITVGCSGLALGAAVEINCVAYLA